MVVMFLRDRYVAREEVRCDCARVCGGMGRGVVEAEGEGMTVSTVNGMRSMSCRYQL